MTLIENAIRLMLIFVTVGAVTFAWSKMNSASNPYRFSGGQGVITPGKISAAFVSLFGLALIVGGIILLVEAEVVGSLACFVFGLPLAVFMSPSLTHLHDVQWDASAVYGPCKMFGPSLWLSRTSITWDDVVATGKTSTSYWFIQASDGRRIYWSYLYPGYGKFVDALASKRPRLTLPADLHRFHLK